VPFDGWESKSGGCLYFRKPTMTAGLTVLFESRYIPIGVTGNQGL
jgi:hypothetical protein